MKDLLDRRGPVNTISHQVEKAQRGGSRTSLAVRLHAVWGISSEAAAGFVYPRSSRLLNCKDQHLWIQFCVAPGPLRRFLVSTSIAVREMKNKDLIISPSLSKQLDYGFVFFQFEKGI